MVCGCADVCTASDGMLTVVRDKHRRAWAFELVSGLNARAAMLGDACERSSDLSVYCIHF